jgi:poly(glycerol-phosphate) alpha-glucosyltransferase
LHDSDNIVTKLTVYGGSGGVIRECLNNAELAALALEGMMKPDRFYALVFESGLLAGAAGKINFKNAARAAVVHSVFLKDPYDLRSGPQMYYRYVCENAGEFDAIVFLTEAERGDFHKKYGAGNTAVIPHPHPYAANRTEFDKRNHRKAVTVARLDALKQVDMAIDIFAIALKKLPDVKFEIYGFGEKEEELKERIKALGLEESVIMMGLTEDPAPIFGSSALFMTASAAEGFPLTLVESVCGGCPVFSFDIKYGPSDIIKDGETGFLIPRFDKELYASKLVAFFEDVELQRTMSDNCYADAGRFSADEFLEKWYNLTVSLIHHNI